DLLLDSIDDSLLILGDEPRRAVYQYLATMKSLERKDIPYRLGDFESGLRSALGGAARVVERLILRKLFQKIGSVFKESNDYEFGEHVTEARRRYELAKLHQQQKDPASANRLKKG
ncbi:MAG TPA: hypothetical protein VE177_01180, partial [Candidatus Binatus sp.]|nr:hypothetical protein [Candidatus Binatus sp.]